MLPVSCMHITNSFQGVMSLQFNQDTTKKSVELIANLDSSVEALLQRWKRKNGSLPQVLFFCRDGVSDAQLHQVLQHELPQIQKACRALYDVRTAPEILLLVTQKRHLVRFYQPNTGSNPAFDKKGNPLPGFVVDSQIVSRDFDDFYAVPHRCLQGTSVPAHHIRVYDDMKCSPDGLQALVNALSYVFGRSTTSISETAPARYAHLLCERAKYHLQDAYCPPPGDDGHYDSNIHFSGEHCIHADLRETMYFV